MEFRIADTFTGSLTKLTCQEQKLVKTTAFDLQTNPASSGLRFHKLDSVRDPNFWSVSVNMDIRIIVHKTDSSMLLCYVDHHDKAYEWALRRKVETHPSTGAAQLVEIRETIKEIIVPKYKEAAPTMPGKQLLFSNKSDEDLLVYGVPSEWLGDVKSADEDSLLVLCEHLPGEAAEALLDLATGKKPQLAQAPAGVINPFEHPDARRRFRVMNNSEELEQALDFPWEKWSVFLHPQQQDFVEREFSGPARVSGSAGTGKTIVALHRAVPKPEISVLSSSETEIATVAEWLLARVNENVKPHELAVFVRTESEIERAKWAVEMAGQCANILDTVVEIEQEKISIATMHLAKGLEFRGVAVMACDDEIIPLQNRIENVGDEADLEEVFNTERQLLYVACTRARDYLLVTGVKPGSEFLDDLKSDIC